MPAFRPEAIRGYTATFTRVADALSDVLLMSDGAPVGEFFLFFFVFSCVCENNAHKHHD